MATRIDPTPGYTYRSPARTPSRNPIVIAPNPDYKPLNLHSAALPVSGPIRRVEAKWCPVCHSGSDTISERLVRGRPVWHCDVCDHEW